MEKIIVGDLTIWPKLPKLEICGREVRLTPRQWELLMALAQCAECLVTTRMLRAVMRHNNRRSVRLKYVNVLISRLRTALATHANGRNFIHPVRPGGYMLQDREPFDQLEQIHKLAA